MTDLHYLVPRPDVPWSHIDRAMGELGAVSQSPQQGQVLVWMLGASIVHLYEDTILHVDQISVEGEDARSAAVRIAAVIPVFSPEDMHALFAAAETGEEMDEALAVLALVAPTMADPDLLLLFRRGLRHEDPLTRQAALIAISVTNWDELRADIGQMAREDADRDVRSLAASVLHEPSRARAAGTEAPQVEDTP